jgi:hypothetical protein
VQQHGYWHPEQIVVAIQRFYAAHGRWPVGKDFSRAQGLPCPASIRAHPAFPTLAAARRQAGMRGGGLEQWRLLEVRRQLEDREHEGGTP